MLTSVKQEVSLAKIIADYNLTSFAAECPFYPHELAYHQMLVDLGLKYLPKGGTATVLDIGTGRGICPRYFAALGVRSISLDFPSTGGTDALRDVARSGVETHECD